MRREGARIRLVRAESGMSEAIFTAKEINRIIGGIDMLDAQERRSPEASPDLPILQFCTGRTGRPLCWKNASKRREFPIRLQAGTNFCKIPR